MTRLSDPGVLDSGRAGGKVPLLAGLRRTIDKLTDEEVDEAIWAASPYRVGPGVGVSATPEAREQARRLYVALTARMRLDGPRRKAGA